MVFLIPIALLGGLILWFYCFSIITVENKSMSPTLIHGDRVLVLRVICRQLLRKRSIVIVSIQDEASYNQEPQYYMKRITGLPGETIVTTLHEVDPIHHSYVKDDHDAHGIREWRVAEDHYFVRGDYHLGGFDSLTWGAIHYRSIKGLMLCRLKRAKRFY